MMKNPAIALAVLAGTMCLSIAYGQDASNTSQKALPTAGQASPRELPSPAEARRQAEVLHDAMHATLQVVHHRYYREDEGLPIPAATLKEVFAELEKEQGVKLRWLVVEGQAMNADHKPLDAFEREAVAVLKSGKGQHEQTDKGMYRRAGPIALTNHCLKCHLPDRKSTEARTAGLIISLPVRAD